MSNQIWGLDLITAYIELDAAYRREQLDGVAGVQEPTTDTGITPERGDQ